VTIDDQIWIAQNGEKYGPYPEATVHQWLSEGKFAPDALAWREGIPDWVPLGGMFSSTSGRHPPPPPGVRSSSHAYASESFSANQYAPSDAIYVQRAELPTPPSLHWGMVLLLDVVTFGIFGFVWGFIQANWIRNIDTESKATLLLAMALACFLIGEPLYLTSIFKPNPSIAQWGALAGLLLLARWILYLVACFSMAGSMERRLKSTGLPLRVGRITLFFFTISYLQAQLSWLTRWKKTGQTSPPASKGTLWAVFFVFPFLIGILAAIAIPAYQDYLVRAQVAEGDVLASGAKTAFAEYYANHHALPPDNTAAGLDPSASIAGRYVSSVNVAGGVVTVAFDTPTANSTIRYQTLVFEPTISGGKISWGCRKYSTVPEKDFPPSCKK